VIMRAIEELKISREQLSVKDEKIRQYKIDVDYYKPEVEKQMILNRKLVNMINEKDEKIHDLKRNRLAYVIAGAAVGILGYVIFVK